jgi:hypothetical protein
MIKNKRRTDSKNASGQLAQHNGPQNNRTIIPTAMPYNSDNQKAHFFPDRRFLCQ